MICCHMALYMTGCHKSTCFSTIYFLHHNASIVKRFLLNKRKQGGAMFFALSCSLLLSCLNIYTIIYFISLLLLPYLVCLVFPVTMHIFFSCYCVYLILFCPFFCLLFYFSLKLINTGWWSEYLNSLSLIV